MFVDSKKEMLETEALLKIAFENARLPYSFEEGLAAVMAESRMPNAIVMRQGNTLFIINYKQNQKDQGMFRALNADTPANYLENSLEFIKAAGLAGFKILVSQFEDASLLQIFKYISRKPPFPGMGYSVQRLRDGGYQVTVNLGTPKSAHGGTLPSAPKKAKGAL